MPAQNSPGMLATGSRVVIVVSSGPPPVTPGAYVGMPELIGKPQGKALVEIQEAGLSSQVFNDYSSVFRRGEVIGQLPSGGTGVAMGSEAVLLVSSGPAAAPMPEHLLPDVMGKLEAEAVTVLQSAGFSPQVVRQSSESVPSGHVSAQLPSRASLAITPTRRGVPWWVWVVIAVIIAGATAFAFLGRGTADKVVVPEVVGLTQAEAVTVLEEVGLRVEVQLVEAEEGEDSDVVREQTPASGTQAEAGSVVQLTVTRPLELVEVPDIEGENQADATSELRAAGFVVNVSRRGSPIVEKGLVIEQAPRAGVGAAPGSEVAIVVSSGPEQQNVSVPDVVGLPRADAQAALGDAGLKVAVAQSPSTGVASDVVISQLPAAGDSVAPGTSVGIVVSTGAPAGETIETPGVVGMTLAEAQQVITDAGLEAIPVASSGDGKPANEVVAQAPESGEQVEAGGSVVLFYSLGP